MAPGLLFQYHLKSDFHDFHPEMCLYHELQTINKVPTEEDSAIVGLFPTIPTIIPPSHTLAPTTPISTTSNVPKTTDQTPIGTSSIPVTTSVASPLPSNEAPKIIDPFNGQPANSDLPTQTGIQSAPSAPVVVQSTIIKEAAPALTTLKPSSTDVVYVTNKSSKGVSFNFWDMGCWILLTAVVAFLFF
ncbi:8499_t:CDS:2 [Funneliformis geosporum]|uniref:8473_t:CDS:1 n=1 Tax=Funneliformis geosporum TaxID=1117311 RepID=A0A9W4SDV1_9GLOM|nr:8473_t:CDS:2 [Funneliformis geosporum]CAI2166655.1 8499_t:CDS:2 [Funneliformis geosporum]